MTDEEWKLAIKALRDQERLDMKCSDIPNELILNYLYQHQGRWTMLFGTEFSTWVEDVLVRASIFPKGVNHKLALAKMRQLYKNGYIGGCDCGCRGDFEITDKGLLKLGKPRLKHYSGYGGN